MKKSSAALASLLALFCLWQGFLSPGTVRIEALAGGVKHVPRFWPLIQAALAVVTLVALLTDAVVLAAACAYLILLLSFITFLGGGLYVMVPAAILVILIGLQYGRTPLSRS
jgi:hypothetical protein